MIHMKIEKMQNIQIFKTSVVGEQELDHNCRPLCKGFSSSQYNFSPKYCSTLLNIIKLCCPLCKGFCSSHYIVQFQSPPKHCFSQCSKKKL